MNARRWLFDLLVPDRALRWRWLTNDGINRILRWDRPASDWPYDDGR